MGLLYLRKAMLVLQQWFALFGCFFLVGGFVQNERGWGFRAGRDRPAPKNKHAAIVHQRHVAGPEIGGAVCLHFLPLVLRQVVLKDVVQVPGRRCNAGCHS